MGRGQGPPQRERHGSLRRPATAPLHRPSHRRRSRGDPDGRALLSARPDCYGQDRGADPRAARPLFDRDRHPQHAAGRARVTAHRLLSPGRARRVRQDVGDFHQSARATHAGLYHRPIRLIGALMMQQASGHTLKAFDEDIERLRALISQMGGLAEHAIDEAMRCLVQRDVDGASRIVQDDKKLDALEIETEKRAVQLIALRAPMAADLRDVVAALKISGVVERIGDYAKNIAKRVPLLENAGKIEPLSLLPEMARIANEMVHDVLDAFVERDAEAAVRVCERDQAVDDFYDSIFRALLTHMMENPHNIGQSAHLLFVAKNLERVGDHATNIAEMVYYAATGQHMADRPGKSAST